MRSKGVRAAVPDRRCEATEPCGQLPVVGIHKVRAGSTRLFGIPRCTHPEIDDSADRRGVVSELRTGPSTRAVEPAAPGLHNGRPGCHNPRHCPRGDESFLQAEDVHAASRCRVGPAPRETALRAGIKWTLRVRPRSTRTGWRVCATRWPKAVGFQEKGPRGTAGPALPPRRLGAAHPKYYPGHRYVDPW